MGEFQAMIVHGIQSMYHTKMKNVVAIRIPQKNRVGS